MWEKMVRLQGNNYLPSIHLKNQGTAEQPQDSTHGGSAPVEPCTEWLASTGQWRKTRFNMPDSSLNLRIR